MDNKIEMLVWELRNRIVAAKEMEYPEIAKGLEQALKLVEDTFQEKIK